MKAIICTRYGPPEVYRICEVKTPVPKDHEILIRIHASSVTTSGSFSRTGRPLFARLFTGLTKPRVTIHGTDLAGEVVKICSRVTRFKVGDYVFAATDTDFGAWAEFTSVSEGGVVLSKADNMNFQQATAILEGTMTALPFLRDKGGIRPVYRLAIIGASGAVGSAAVQLGKFFWGQSNSNMRRKQCQSSQITGCRRGHGLPTRGFHPYWQAL